MGKALRDYKAIAKHMVKLAYPFKDVVKFSLSFNVYIGDYYTLSVTMFMEIRVNSNAFTWYEDTKGNLFYCLDTKTAFDTSNIVSYKYGSGSKYTSFDDFITKVCNEYMKYMSTNYRAEEALQWLHTLLDRYGIPHTQYAHVKDLMAYTNTYNSFMESLHRDIKLKVYDYIRCSLQKPLFYTGMKGLLKGDGLLTCMRFDTNKQLAYTPYIGSLMGVNLMSKSMDGKDGRRVTSFDIILDKKSVVNGDNRSITMELHTADIKTIQLGE